MSNGSSSPLQDLINMVEGVELSVNSFTEVANLRARLLAGLTALGLFPISNNPVTVLSVAQPNETLTNSTLNDQNFTSIFTIPANLITTGKVLRVLINFSSTSDAAASSILAYIKLGATKVITATVGVTPVNAITRSFFLEILIIGTNTPGAAVAVQTSTIATSFNYGTANFNATLPQNLATNGPLNIIPGLAYGTNTGGESTTLLSAIVESLN